MTSLLTWDIAGRGDREPLKQFQCTEAGSMVRRAGRWESDHSSPWELSVQARIHRDLKPPQPTPPFRFWLGKDAEGVGAVLFYEELDGPAQVEVHYAAVALRYRYRGGGCADEMMGHLFDELTSRALEAGTHVVQVMAWIHEGNRPSQRMFRQFQLRQVGQGEAGLQRWSGLIPVAGASIAD